MSSPSPGAKGDVLVAVSGADCSGQPVGAGVRGARSFAVCLDAEGRLRFWRGASFAGCGSGTDGSNLIPEALHASGAGPEGALFERSASDQNRIMLRARLRWRRAAPAGGLGPAKTLELALAAPGPLGR